MKVGDIVLVRFPFTDLENTKKRPALLLKQIIYSPQLRLTQIAMITSHLEAPEIDGDLLIEGWQKSGLLHPSKLRLAKIATIEGELIQGVLGRLSDKDWVKIRKKILEHFNEWK